MKGVSIKTAVSDQMGNTYEGAFVVFVISTQQRGGNNSGQGGTVEELASRGEFYVLYRTYKTKEDARLAPMRNFPLFTSAGVPVGDVVIKLTDDEKKDFGIKILNQKVLTYFQDIFGADNVELEEE